MAVAGMPLASCITFPFSSTISALLLDAEPKTNINTSKTEDKLSLLFIIGVKLLIKNVFELPLKYF
jgi:hypothetical protein